MKFTVIGASGFIGSALAKSLKACGNEVFAPHRGDVRVFTESLGHTIYAAGITADFRSRPFDTLRANTGFLCEILEKSSFESLLYLSSARIYRHAEHSGEDAAIYLRSGNPEDLYDLTKLTAEAMCHNSGKKSVRIVRLTNVVGSDFRSQNFLFDIIRSACDKGYIELRSTLDSEKDYVLLQDILSVIPKIVVKGRSLCYNIASGYNLTNETLINSILACTNARFTMREDAHRIIMPTVNIDLLRNEFDYKPSPVLPYIPQLIYEYRQFNRTKN